MHKSVEAGRQSDSLATCLFMPHVPHATCCKRADTHTACLLDSCLTKCLVDFWKICTTRRQLAPWQAGSQACLPPCTCPCPALSLKKCTKWRALSARQLVVPLSSFILPVEQGNRIFVAGKRDCQVFHCTGTPLPPCLPLLCGSGGTHNA